MANKTIATPQKEELPKKEGPETPPDSPPLDLSDAAVKKLIRCASLARLVEVPVSSTKTSFVGSSRSCCCFQLARAALPSGRPP